MATKPPPFYPSYWDVVHTDGYDYNRSDTNDAALIQKYFRIHGSMYEFIREAYGITDRGQVFLKFDYPPNYHTIMSMHMGESIAELKEMGMPGSIIRPHLNSTATSGYYQLSLARFKVKDKRIRVPISLMNGITSGKLARWSFLKPRVMGTGSKESVTYKHRPENMKLVVDYALQQAFENSVVDWKLEPYEKERAYDAGLRSLKGYV